ncbi:MAG: arylesterase [Gammaproteobacteria bacterium]
MMRIFLVCCWILVAGLARAEPAAPAPVILVVGDSLSAAYGIPRQSGWVSLLATRLDDRGYPHRVVNASVSGETTAGGLSRLPALLDRHAPRLVLLELGGNDGLRAQPPQKMRDNLSRMVQMSRAAGAEPVLFEMRIPANYGPAYAQDFQQSFARVAREQEVTLVPFFLAAIATDERWFQPDGIHPTAEAQPRMLEAVWPVLEPLLSR